MITQERLKDLLSYDPETGIFTWLKPTNCSIRVGASFGSAHHTGYITAHLDHKHYATHRLAWLYVHGEWPEFIDHINHVRNDNRIVNLRNVTKIENGRNQKLRSTNKSGVMGVYWDKGASKWRAVITHNNKKVHLGWFKDLDDAATARKLAEIRYDYHENHGKP